MTVNVTSNTVLFDRVAWRDPVTGVPMTPIVTARNPVGLPIAGALRVGSTDVGYPIIDSVARLTPELAHRHRSWLTPLGLRPPEVPAGSRFQPGETVASFGFQWSWNSEMRSPADLEWRVASRFHVKPTDFDGCVTLDAGAGAGDQSAWLLDQGAEVVSVDLSSAIDVVARKLRLRPNWVGVQADLTALPFAGSQFDRVYCEGVIQHTQDSALTVQQLTEALVVGGVIQATHYSQPRRFLGRMKHAYLSYLRRRLSGLERYRLLLVTGNLAALAHTPLIGGIFRVTGTAIYSDRMPDFKTTWTNTLDHHGSHTYQRHITPADFWSYFEQTGIMKPELTEGTLVVARRTS